LLALGTLIRAEWLVNPLLGSAEIAVLYFLGKEVYDETTGRIAALLGVVSPFLLTASSEYSNHGSCLLFLSFFLLFFFRTIRPLRGVRGSSSLADPLLSGLSLAMALNTRPLTALAISIPIAGYAIYLMLNSRGRTLPAFLVLLVPVLLASALSASTTT
jgi:4-amino-4-deoxy-L-arabinose transferase-like glycosyltransferase